MALAGAEPGSQQKTERGEGGRVNALPGRCIQHNYNSRNLPKRHVSHPYSTIPAIIGIPGIEINLKKVFLFCVQFSVAKLCLTLWDPIDCRPSGSSVHGNFRASILEQVVTAFSSRSSQSRDRTRVSCISCTGRWILYHCAT